MNRPRAARFILCALLTASACAHGRTAAVFPVPTAADAIALRAPAASSDELSPDELRDLIRDRRTRVAEFAFLREWAAKRGLRVWAAGGSAAGFAYYVKQHAEHERLLARGQPSPYFDSRFRYNYFQVFRSTQDADIVLDATDAEAGELEQALRERFPYLQGSKSTWEVRLLRYPRGEGAGLKEPLIDNPNFLDQNSDSHSTGMVELTDPPRRESVVRDLFDWKNQKNPVFLRDVAEGKLRFYRNPRHFGTSRAKQGLNPEILSVIRALTKSFQYGPEIREEDLPEMRAIVAAFDPADPALEPAKGQIENNAKKLYSHAENLERAYLTLEGLELREKLLRFGGVGTPKPSGLAQLLNRIPLLSRDFGKTGRTAAEVFGAKGPIVVAHETSELLVFESITRSRLGRPNVLASRQGEEGRLSGEKAVYGDGFYTKLGREGARRTGITIRFELDPRAREGEDFVFVRDKDYVIVRNRRALRVIDESVEMKPLDFFRFVSRSEFAASDRGIWEMLGMMMRADSAVVPPAERRKIVGWALEAMKETAFPPWVARFLIPVESLRADLAAALKRSRTIDRDALAKGLWASDAKTIAAWSGFLRDAGALESSLKEIDPMFRALFDSPGKHFQPCALIPFPGKSVGAHAQQVLERAELLEGRANLIKRLAGLAESEPYRLLGLVLRIANSERPKAFELLREAGIVDRAIPLIDASFRSVSAGEDAGKTPLLWRWNDGMTLEYRPLAAWAHAAIRLEGQTRFRARVEAWDFATLERVLLNLRSSSPERDFIVDRLMRHPDRPADLALRWDEEKVSIFFVDVRLRLGPVTADLEKHFTLAPASDQSAAFLGKSSALRPGPAPYDHEVILGALGRLHSIDDRDALQNAVRLARRLSGSFSAMGAYEQRYENFVQGVFKRFGRDPQCPDLLRPAS